MTVRRDQSLRELPPWCTSLGPKSVKGGEDSFRKKFLDRGPHVAHEAVFSRQIPTGTFFFFSRQLTISPTQTRTSIPGLEKKGNPTNANGVASLEDHGNPLKDRKIL